MNGLIMAGQLILSLSILVTLHELGHFLAARAFGIKVEKFYLFFDAWGFKLFSITKGETEYGIGWLPLGGYVKIAGMIDESMDKEAMAQPAQPYEFRSKPAWQRLIVMVAGVTMNVLLGIAIYSLSLLNYTKSYLPNEEVKNGIYAYRLGKEVGLQDGDRIIAIDGKSFQRFDDLLSTRVMFGATLTVVRNGQTFDTQVPDNFYRSYYKSGGLNFIGLGDVVYDVSPIDNKDSIWKAGLRSHDTIVAVEGEKIMGGDFLSEKLSTLKGKEVTLRVKRTDQLVEVKLPVNKEGKIGMYYRPVQLPKDRYEETSYTVGSALKFGTSDAVESLVANAKGLRKVFTGEEKATDSIQGPIGIATIFGAKWDWMNFWRITGLLSMILAFMNILPIPALDGGHVIFLLIEAITQRKFSDKFMERSQVVGMVILLSLMVFAVGNDIWKHILN
ncbi:MAG: RIP metalloprotease RseP, partial [Bacteroidia bacterium]